MDTTLTRSSAVGLWGWVSRFFARFAVIRRIHVRLPALKLGADDPAALYYVRGKYIDEID